ncbi:MAG: PAS domain S-box protein [Acidobacteriaceae bacterium]|nr:PAS domain S-box protein [Acidobacteriaceae bacterium]MBV9500085.1 PAS domain S-box protein [Acidobacteriaceae bacterium]
MAQPLTAEELLKTLIDELTEFVVILLDNQGQFTSWHPGVFRQFGYKSDEFIGRPLDLLLPPSERCTGKSSRELQQAAITGRSSDTTWLVHKDGHPIFVEGITIPLRSQSGELHGFGKIITDVTERKNAEDDLRALARALEQSTVLIRTWDGHIEHWTSGCERLYGWTAEEAVGRIEHELLQTGFPEPLEAIEQQLLEFGTWTGELTQKRRDGTVLMVSAQWVLLSDEADEPRTIIATHTDITARSEIQHELESVNARLKSMAYELERSNEDLEEFARIASHDLSAPITSTRWLVDLLSSRYGSNLDSEGQKCLKQISVGLERMADLVEAVLEHARVGKTMIGSSDTADAGEALAAAIEDLSRDIQTSGATITHDPLPGLLIQLQPLTRLFQNLLSNAIKYRRPGVPIEVKITAGRQGALWVIGVQDNGMGIEPDWFDRIFQPLQRRHGLDVAGSGIGLATCKKIVTRAGGKIWVESEVGRGSTFFFAVPGAYTEPA